MDPFAEKRVSSEKIYSGEIMEVSKDRVTLPDGNETNREVVSHSGGVAVLAVDEYDQLVLIKQHRYSVGETIYELPAGKLEENENPEECGMRELQEETGYQAKELEHIFSFYTSPGYSTEKIHLYLAKNLKFVGRRLDPGEFIEVEKFNRDKIVEMMQNKQFNDSKTLIGVLHYLNNLSDKNA